MVLKVEGQMGERADRRRRSQHERSTALAGPAAMEAPPSAAESDSQAVSAIPREQRLMGSPLGVNQTGASGLWRSIFWRGRPLFRQLIDAARSRPTEERDDLCARYREGGRLLSTLALHPR
jgi:hypothetical protein